MVKYEPKYIEKNYNVSETNILKVFITDLFYIFVAIWITILLFGVLSNLFIENLSVEQEKKIVSNLKLSSKYKSSYISTDKYLQKIVDKLSSNIQNNKRKFYVITVPSNNINAFALPDGNIILNSKLIENSSSENELAFVIAHEMGHIVHKDSLKAISKSILSSAVLSVLNINKDILKFINASSDNLQYSFSRKIEQRTDIWALDLVYKTYGNSSGTAEFFNKLNKYPDFAYYFSTHPSPQERKKILQSRIKSEKYLSKNLINCDYIINSLKTEKSNKF